MVAGFYIETVVVETNETHIKEIIDVEGKMTQYVAAFFDCDTIETGGDQVNEKTIERVRQAQKTRESLSLRILIRQENIFVD